MKIEFRLNRFFTLLVIILVSTGCLETNSDDIEIPPESVMHTCKMIFNGNISCFDSNDTRAVSYNWQDGDNIFLALYNDDVIIPAVASYDDTDRWTLNFNTLIKEGENLKLTAFYFSDFDAVNSCRMNLKPHAGIYEELNGSYTYTNNTLIVNALLTPKTGRIRFSGTPGETLKIVGLETFNCFNPTNTILTVTDEIITVVVNKDGYTPYIYGDFSNSYKVFSLVGDDFVYTRTCDETVLAKGKSGYMSIPTEKNHNGWVSELLLNINGCDLKMIPVSDHDSGFFLIAETETTEAFYNSVIGEPSASLLPQSNLSSELVQSFVEALNKKTNLRFALPSLKQWKYAAMGGNKSRGYNYAGSDSVYEVAWFSSNTYMKQKVKQLAPNELGIYDMSGNVSELINFNSDDIVYYDAGGSYRSDIFGVGVNHYDENRGEAVSDIGFRLILTF